jgi:hypothetical protein
LGQLTQAIPLDADYTDSYERVLPRLNAIKDEDLIPVTLNVQAVVMTSLGVAPEVQAMRERIVKALPLVDIELIDLLADAARALLHVSARNPQSQQQSSLAPRAAQAYQARTRLLRAVQPLVDNGLVDAAVTKSLLGGSAYGNTASDIITLVTMLRAAWSRVHSYLRRSSLCTV